jgi:anti-anti-sigma factor
MEIDIRDEGSVKLVRFQGRLDSNTSAAAESELTGLLGAGASQLLLDFEHLDYISSAGLRIVLATAKRIRAKGGALRLCSLNEMVFEVFEISGFVTLLDVHPTQAEALAAFG